MPSAAPSSGLRDRPRGAVNVVRRHVGSLRRLLEPGFAGRAEGRLAGWCGARVDTAW
ncbi:hypothetical protein OG352_04160 [Streptomyces sp. NBC_01485]|uniref:hypothetical protein n=1 Tax=Streptomyces sp. NBC_01485 TaxID=2903884 RepID=UPI002E33BDAC|nr:hypothetical protein [Streptomyces sp. NBC_01485]